MESKQPRDREQQIKEQGFVDAEEHLAAEALKHAAEAAEQPVKSGKAKAAA